MIISIKLTPQDEKYVRDFAASRDMKVSEYIRQAVIDRLDYESDFQCNRNTVTARSNNVPVIYSLDKSGNLVTI